MLRKKVWKNWFQYSKTIVFFIAILIIAIYHFFFESNVNVTCPIEYGRSQCVEGKLLIPFYNPNNVSIEKLRLIVPTKRGKDIYNVKEPLLKNETKILVLNKCYDSDISRYVIQWCCKNKCYTQFLANPSEEIMIIKTKNYGHPTIKKCYQIEDGLKRQFCIGDVAEITNNITLCYELVDPDILNSCLGRVTLNSTYCEKIRDKSLSEACKASIEMKRRWLGIS